MSNIQVSLLGPITAYSDGREVPLAGKQIKAVLAILALAAGRTVTVDQLVADLWPAEITAGATNTLQTYVSAIRRAAGDSDVVQRRGPGYALAVERGDVDALRFESLIGEARVHHGAPRHVVATIERALELWKGRPLADVDGEPFAIGPIARLEDLHAEALERLFDAELALGGHHRVIGRLEEVVAGHPYRERFAGQLALAQYRAGRQADALRTIDRSRTTLLEGLGLSIGDELVGLERAILNQDPELAAPEARPAHRRHELPRPVTASLVHPMLGRAVDIDMLQQRWRDALAGRCSTVVVAGEPGVGKTRLVAELAADVHRSGHRVLWGRCSEGSRLPYEPFVEAVGAAGPPGQPGVAFAGRPSSPATDPGLALLALHEAVAATLADALGGGGLLVIDDVQWADSTTTAMLAHVVDELANLPVLVVISRRAGSPNLDLDRALADVRRSMPLHRLSLSGIDVDAARQLVQDVRGHRDDALAGRLHARTSGNPFFLHELLATREDDPTPATVAEAVALRVGPPDQPLGRLLGAAAVLDRDADLDLLAAVARLEEEDALNALDQALAGDLLRETADGAERLSFSHAIVRDTAYQALTSARRRRLHRQAAAALAARHDLSPPGRHQVEIARHLLAAGTAAQGTELLDAAAAASRWCLDVLAYEDAVDFAVRALALAADQPTADAEHRRHEAALRLALGQALNATGDASTAREQLRAVVQAAKQLGDRNLLAGAALAMAGGPGAGAGVRWGVVDLELVAAIEAALAVTPATDERTHARLLAALSQAVYHDPGSAARCDDASATAVAIAERLDDPPLLGATLIARCIALWGPSGLQERIGLARRAARIAASSGDDALAIAAHVRLLPDAFEAGDLATVRSSVDQLDEITARLRQPRYCWFVPLARGALALTVGDLDGAQAHADEALAVASGAQGDGPALSHLVGVAMIERDRGDMSAVESALRDRMARSPWMVTPRALLALALADSGRFGDAMALVANDLTERLSTIPRDYLWFGHVGLIAEVVAHSGNVTHAHTVHAALGEASGRLLMLGATAPVGAADRALGLMSATTGDLDGAVAELHRGRDLHRRLGARYLEARTEADLHHVHLARGDADAAARALARATAVAADLRLAPPTSPLATLART